MEAVMYHCNNHGFPLMVRAQRSISTRSLQGPHICFSGGTLHGPSVTVAIGRAVSGWANIAASLPAASRLAWFGTSQKYRQEGGPSKSSAHHTSPCMEAYLHEKCWLQVAHSASVWLPQAQARLSQIGPIGL